MARAGQTVKSALFLPRPGKCAWLLFTALIIVLSALAFAGLRHHKIDTHDEETFLDNIALSQDFSYFFLPPQDRGLASGRPFAELLKFLAFLVFGNDPSYFHLLVVASHTLASLLVAAMAISIGVTPAVGFSAGLLFLYNIAHFQAVHWISALDYSLSLSWAIAAVLCWSRYAVAAKNTWLVAFFAALVLSVFSHISGIAALPFCAYWSWNAHPDRRREYLGRLALVALFIVPALIYALDSAERTTGTWHSIQLYQEKSAWDLLVGHARMSLWFASRLFTTAHWLPLPAYRMQIWELYLGGAALLVMAFLAWHHPRSSGLGAVWALFFLAPFAILPEAIVLDLPTGPSRYLYSATAGSSLLLAFVIDRGAEYLAVRSPRVGRIFYATCLMAILTYSAALLKRVEAFSFFTSGRSYLTAHDPDAGVAQLRRALDTGGDLIDAHDAYARMGMVLLQKPNEAQSLLQEALEQYPESISLNLYKLTFESMYGDAATRQQSLAHLQGITGEEKVNLIVGQSYFNIGSGLLAQQDYTRAVEAYGLSQYFLPDRPQTLKNLVFSLLALDRYEESIVVLERAVLVDDDLENHFMLGKLYLKQENKLRARGAFEQVVRLAPASAEAAVAREFLRVE